ncbi:hypothetical protein WA026_015638 [Henosepilachna vigintioctopunctata]|uniref:Uncharacterized protein n=1 Tax=Henosepilachna vigintioctopunctata TaxID=420089 RepID=A0AAW1V7I8_9CUCU
MEWKQVGDHNVELSRNVAEWHQQEQLVYWKSRALSLEYENRMLHKHLRDVYAQQIENYKYYNNLQELDEGNVQTDSNNENYSKTYVNKSNLEHLQSRFSRNINETEPTAFEPPCEPIGKKRREEMENFYGSNCSKIAGVETALQLNYEHALSKLKPVHWPELQLNFGKSS